MKLMSGVATLHLRRCRRKYKDDPAKMNKKLMGS